VLRGEEMAGWSGETAALARRSTLGWGLTAAGLGASLTGAEPAFAARWGAFRDRFVHPEGRVIDTGNHGISHSEGQGYGLLFAEAAGDAAGFARILAWTEAHLRRPDCALHAWRYTPGRPPLADDPNNATDGDLLIAWALARSAMRGGPAAHLPLAAAIAGDILRHCVVTARDRSLLLPGLTGFQHPGHRVVNLSYYLFPAFRMLAKVLPGAAWARLEAGGLDMLAEARFGRWGLPADWIEVPEAPKMPPGIASEWPGRFSWDAVRIPLHLVWGGLAQCPVVKAAVSFWRHPEFVVQPAWVDLRTGAVSPYAAPPGVEAVASLAKAAMEGGPLAGMPRDEAAEDYYNAALLLLSRLAWEEARRVA